MVRQVQPRWRSPLRGPWLTSVLGLALLIALPLVVVTGLLDYIAYGPQFHQALPHTVGPLHLPDFTWPTRPAWLFRVTEGLHVVVGVVAIPAIVVKLWSVIPQLFARPPARSFSHLLERLSLVMLVGGILFEVVTGLLNIQYDYIFPFSFYTAHYYGAWVFIVGFIVHVALKLPKMLASLRRVPGGSVLHTGRDDTRPEDVDDELVARDAAPATLSRRGLLGMALAGSGLLAALTVGQVIGGPLRRTAILLPRGRGYGDRPNDFQINHTAAAYGPPPSKVGSAWRLELGGRSRTIRLDRAALQTMPQHTATLPISCVEGWATQQRWTGVRLRDLAALVSPGEPVTATVRALSPHGESRAILAHNQVMDRDSLLALRVNDADLSLDHGYPARIIVPNLPGVHCTKWVASIHFEAT